MALALLVCTAYLALLAYGAFQLTQAQVVVATLRSVRLGAPLGQQPSSVAFHQDVCEEGFCYVEKDVSNLPKADFWGHRSSEIPSLLPWKWWTVSAGVKVDSTGNAVAKWLSIDDGKYFQYPTVRVFVGADPSLFDRCRHAQQIRHPGYRSRREMRTGALYLDLSVDADEQWVDRAFQLRLNCLNTTRGRKDPGDIAPAGWQDQIDDRKLEDSDIANRAREPNSCRAVM